MGLPEKPEMVFEKSQGMALFSGSFRVVPKLIWNQFQMVAISYETRAFVKCASWDLQERNSGEIGKDRLELDRRPKIHLVRCCLSEKLENQPMGKFGCLTKKEFKKIHI